VRKQNKERTALFLGGLVVGLGFGIWIMHPTKPAHPLKRMRAEVAETNKDTDRFLEDLSKQLKETE